MDDQLPVGQLDLIDKGIHKAAAVGVGALGRGDTELLKQEDDLVTAQRKRLRCGERGKLVIEGLSLIHISYTHYNTDFTNDIFHMADLGFTELSMEPVVTKPTDPSALTAEDLPILKEQYEILAKEMIKRDREGRGFTFYHYMIDLTGGPCIYKRISGCGSGTEYMAVTPWGDLYQMCIRDRLHTILKKYQPLG